MTTLKWALNTIHSNRILEKIPFEGLSDLQVQLARERHGTNLIFENEKSSFLYQLFEILKEPMLILLLAASTLYFFLGQWEDGILLLVAVSIVASISFYQNIKSEKALYKLKKLTEPEVQVIRNGALSAIPIEDLVMDDVFWIEEGQTIPADAKLLKANDLQIDESILTGESIAVAKAENEVIFAGTILTSGSAWCVVSAIGIKTQLGRLGKSMQEIVIGNTPLQIQVQKFVKQMTLVGLVAFFAIWGINFLGSGNIITSLLFGLTIAMAMIPEEIPVAFSSFMALGAAKLSAMGILARQPQTVESLGAATVICVDKTGTITQDKMELQMLYLAKLDQLVNLKDPKKLLSEEAKEVLIYSRLSSEIKPFDAMEKAIDECFRLSLPDVSLSELEMVHEYPLSGKPPIMTHIFKNGKGDFFIAAKGGVETLLNNSGLEASEKSRIQEVAKELSSKGLRVLAVGKALRIKDQIWPESQLDFDWEFLGFIGLYNPPKSNAKEVIGQFYKAGIQVKMITGDYPETAKAIAKEVEMDGAESVLTGAEILEMPEDTLRDKIKATTVFARMFPEAKLRIINALKASGEVVAMTGDGVNDGPALKAADIGVAMGKRGTEVAKQAASLVLVEDDLAAMLLAISHGRKIYFNLKKAISYIVSIHIPIILTVTIPLVFQWKLANIFSPIHVIFLELVMGPTCSIAFENEPAEKNLMLQKPRRATESFLFFRELVVSIVQGLAISCAVLGVYFWTMESGQTIEMVRTSAFVTLVFSNIFLTLTNRSFTQSLFQTLFRPNNLLWMMLIATSIILASTLFISPVQQLFDFQMLTFRQIGYCLMAGLVGVFWMEGLKAIKRLRKFKGKSA